MSIDELALRTTHVLAYLGLGFFWLHTLLMAAHALQEAGRLGARGRAWAQAGGLRRGKVVSGSGHDEGDDGDDGTAGSTVARHVVAQVGRSKGDGKIHFHDRAYEAEVLGARIELDDGEVVELAPGAGFEIWTDPASLRARAEAPAASEFEAAYASARKARGFLRRLESPVRVGDEVWLFGAANLVPADALADEDIGGVVFPDPRHPLLADFDPRGWLRRKVTMATAVAAAMILLAAGCTVAIFWPPAWGLVSKLGAVAAIAVFNLQQLFLKLVRDATRLPPFAHVRGKWQGPRP